jgi:hypothetical protein
LIRIADESIEVAIASQRIYIEIIAHIVFYADTRVGREAIAIGEKDRASVVLSHDGGIQIGPGISGARKRVGRKSFNSELRAAIDMDCVTGNPSRLLRGEKNDDPTDVVRLGNSLQSLHA